MDMNGLNNTMIYSQANIDWPRWSPDGSQILYAVYNSGLWIIESDGSNPRLVVAEFEGEDLRHPAWSPDGSRIIFTRRVDNNDDIWIVDIDTSAEAQLVDHSARDMRPEWASIILPDQNDCIIFSYKAEETDHYDLWMIRPDGSDLKDITNTVDWDEHSPAIHSQSGQIGYIIEGGAPLQDEGLFVIGIGESTPLPIALRSDFDGLEIADPVWIDANTLVFTVGRDGDRALYHADIPSLQVQRICSMADALGNQAKEGFVTDVSPDGLQLIVCAERGNWTPTYDLYLMNTNGTQGELLYGDNPDKYIDGIAKWSPDNQTIAFTHDYTGGAYQDPRYFGIVSMNPIIPGTVGLDGITELYELTSRSEFALLQDWSPDSTKLLFFVANHYGFHQNMTDLRGNLWLMDRDGNNAKPLTSLDGWFRSIDSYVSLACWGQLEDSKSFDRD
jgi:Tol biopolymer transport system component